MLRVHFVIRGRVQGVGFRYFVVRRARALQLTGWVRNHPDGHVEVEAVGGRQALEALLETLRQGPPAARVTGIEEAWSEADADYRDFEVTG